MTVITNRQFLVASLVFSFVWCTAVYAESNGVDHVASDLAASEQASLVSAEVVGKDPNSSAEVILEAQSMLAKPEGVKKEEWLELSARLEVLLPVIASSQQEIRNQLRDARAGGIRHASLSELLAERDRINKAIEAAIEELPEVSDLKDRASVEHVKLLGVMKLRTQIQQQIAVGEATTADEAQDSNLQQPSVQNP